MQHHFADLIGAAARGVCRQPAVAQIAVLRVRHDGFFINDRGDRGGEQAQHVGRADVGGPADLHVVVVDFLQESIDVLFGPAELRQNKRGIEVELHHAAQREDDIFRAQRIAAGEFSVFAQFEGQAAVIAARLPAAGERRFQIRRVLRIGLDQALIKIGKGLHAGQFKPFGRIEAVGVIDRLSDNQGIFRRGGLRGKGGCQRKR